MSDNKGINISVIPKSINNALENVLEPPSKSIGETFSEIWYLVLGGPVEILAEKRKIRYAKSLALFKKQIESEINKIPEDKRVEADIQITGTALEASKYCADKKELRDMFARIIASSMNADRKNDVRPLYVDIIGKMSINAARLFKIMYYGDVTTYKDMSEDEIYIALEELMQFRLIVGRGDYARNHCVFMPSRTGFTFYRKDGEIMSCPADPEIHQTKESIGTFTITSLGASLQNICFYH